MGVIRPEEFDEYFEDPSIFSIRNEAAHFGKVTATDKQITSAFHELGKIIEAYVEWAERQRPNKLADLDDFISAQVSERGVMLPGET